MKPLCYDEIKLLAKEVNNYKDFKFQNCFIDNKKLVILLYKNINIYISIDLNLNAPTVLVFKNKYPFSLIKNKKPILIFLKKYFKEEHLSEVSVGRDGERKITLHFNNKEIGVTLFPQGKNIEVSANDKNIFLSKPKYLEGGDRSNFKPSKIRNSDEIITEYVNFIEKKIKKPKLKDSINSELKVKKILIKLNEDLELKLNKKWVEAAKYLQTLNSLDVLSEVGEFAKYIEPTQTVIFNIERCYLEAKKNKTKIHNLLIRIHEIENNGLFSVNHISNITTNKKKDTKKELGRTLWIDDRNYFFVGKNAKDNISCLRKSKPWHLWVHLRDHTSAHGFISLDKKTKYATISFNKVFRYLIEQNFKNKINNHINDIFEIIVTECRYVTPIKGDKLGRVTYSKEKTYNYKYTMS